MKICYICGEYPPGPQGGIGTVVQLAARKLVTLGHEVKVIGVYDDDRYPGNFYEDEGVQVHRIREKGKGLLSFAYASYRQFTQIRRWAGEGKIDIVEAPESRGWFAFWPKLKIPCVIRAHGSNTNDKLRRNVKPSRITRFLEQQSYSRADGYSAVSKSAANDAQTTFHLKKPINVIYNGIEFIPVRQADREKNTIINVGTLMESKGVITLIKALNRLDEEGVNFRLDLFGKNSSYANTDMQSYLESLLRPAIQGRVKFHGHVEREKLFPFYSQSAVAVFPSKWESFGLGPVEAMMCGCAVIYSDIPSGREIIDDGISGLLVKPDDDQQLAEKIQLLLSDEPLREKFGAAAILKVKNTFTLDVMCEELLGFYKNIMSNFSY